MRWEAIQFIGYEDKLDQREKWWSEETVSEDFDMALRLQASGYVVRLAGYTALDNTRYEEGVRFVADKKMVLGPSTDSLL